MDLCNLKGMYRVNSSEMQVVTEPLKVLRPNEILKWTLKNEEPVAGSQDVGND